MQEVVNATAPIADAAAREAWPYKKVMLAVLPPTLALLSVVIGVWDNGNRDRNARAEAAKDRGAATLEAEKARADAASEAEATRKAEVEKDQAAAEAAQQLRVAQLVQPKYEILLADLHHTMTVVHRCEDDLNTFLQGFGIDPVLGTTWSLADRDMPPIDPAGFGVTPVRVDDSVIESCGEIEASLEPLELSLDQARLVSIPSLERAATNLGDALHTGSEGANSLLDRIDGDGFIELLDDGSGAYLPDGTPLIRRVFELNQSLTAITIASEDLIESARGVVLVLGP